MATNIDDIVHELFKGELIKVIITRVAACEIKYKPYNSAHEASAIIREEFEEFWEEVRKKKPDAAAMRDELIDIATTAIRAIINLKL